MSIADLGGTNIDLRFFSSKGGHLFVIVTHFLRFSDVTKTKLHLHHCIMKKLDTPGSNYLHPCLFCVQNCISTDQSHHWIHFHFQFMKVIMFGQKLQLVTDYPPKRKTLNS